MTLPTTETFSKRFAVKVTLLKARQDLTDAISSGLLAHPEIVRLNQLLEDLNKVLEPWDAISEEVKTYGLEFPTP